MSGYMWDDATAQGLIDSLKAQDGAALPMLHALNDHFGYVDARAVPLVAEALNISRAEVHGILTFYHDFRTQPAPRRVIKLCRAEACQSLGCEELAAGATGEAIIETVYCLGLCAQGPAALVEGEVIARLDAPKLAALMNGASPAQILAGEGV
jgi:formate dehydrogenase subunit gamma